MTPEEKVNILMVDDRPENLDSLDIEFKNLSLLQRGIEGDFSRQ